MFPCVGLLSSGRETQIPFGNDNKVRWREEKGTRVLFMEGDEGTSGSLGESPEALVRRLGGS